MNYDICKLNNETTGEVEKHLMRDNRTVRISYKTVLFICGPLFSNLQSYCTVLYR